MTAHDGALVEDVVENYAGDVDAAWIARTTAVLEKASWNPKCTLEGVYPIDVLSRLLSDAQKVLKKEPTVVDVRVPVGARVNVVGDTHGQFHDVLRLFLSAGLPSETNLFVFNGDFVDRGAWGVEVLTTLLSWKLAFPDRVFLTRGNHESTSCTQAYGFCKELSVKYAGSDWKRVYKLCKAVFAALPLSAVIEGKVLVLHGGLFRGPPPPRRTPKKSKAKGKRKADAMAAEWGDGAIHLGTLKQLRACGKGGVDPDETRANQVMACDVMWSDPQSEEGIALNDKRGVGLLFGPDVTEQFLQENDIELIIRSHEGPDSRVDREDDMKSLQGGFSIDHECASGKLVTVFSAPDYPQFVDESERTRNTAAYAVLTQPSIAKPQFRQFEAALPRPDVSCFFDEEGEDEEEAVEEVGGDE